MKRQLYICLFLLPFVHTVAQEVFKNDQVTVSVLKENVLVFETFDNTTMYLIEGDEQAALIDMGTTCDGLDQIVKQLCSKPLIVIGTHAHPDHIGCIDQFEKVWLHKADSVLIKQFAKDYKGDILYLEAGQVFDLGGRKLEVDLMPGHTPGSIVLLDKENGDCYTGDAFGSGQVWLQTIPHTPIKVYYESCVRMEKIMNDTGISRIYCGHYPYLKKALDLGYLIESKDLAKRISDGEDVNAVYYPYTPDKDNKNIVIARNGFAMIVYDSENIN